MIGIVTGIPVFSKQLSLVFVKTDSAKRVPLLPASC
jgi:hypothetical protein